MVAAGSGALLIADRGGWSLAYLAIAVAAFLPFPILAAMKPDREGGGGRAAALATGTAASVAILAATALATAAIGWLVLGLAAGAGVDAKANVTPGCWARALSPSSPWPPRCRASAARPPTPRSAPPRRSGPYVDFFWRYGFAALVLMAFVSIYRMGDVLALNLSKPMIKELGYSLTQIGRADSFVALGASVVGVGLGGLLVTRWPMRWTLALGAVVAAIGNFGFVWLAHQHVDKSLLYLATGADQFGNGFAGAVFVVYLSLLVNPRYPGAQYALPHRLRVPPAAAAGGGGGHDGGGDRLRRLLPALGRLEPRRDPVPARARAHPGARGRAESRPLSPPAAAALAAAHPRRDAGGRHRGRHPPCDGRGPGTERCPEEEPLTRTHWFDLASVEQGDRDHQLRPAPHRRGPPRHLDRPLTDAIPDLRQYDVANAGGAPG
ncbi:hypothetical protein AB5I41_26060 [Sphingomonas sp. MMS24-JH45]